MTSLRKSVADATAILVRLDERIARSPVGSGWIERMHFGDACASLWIDGEPALYDTTRDIRSPIRREDGRFDLNAILCGSEGTLAMIAEAELNLLPIPAKAALVNIRYGDFNAALEDARSLTALKVASVETVDEKVLSLAR